MTSTAAGDGNANFKETDAEKLAGAENDNELETKSGNETEVDGQRGMTPIAFGIVIWEENEIESGEQKAMVDVAQHERRLLQLQAGKTYETDLIHRTPGD